MGSNGIPVLLHHHVNNNGGREDGISPDLFEEQVRFLVSEGYQTIFLGELIHYIKEGEELPTKTVVLTFDDGNLDNWVYAYPILRKYELKATLFVITGRIGEKVPNYRPNLEDLWNGKASEEDLPFIDTDRNINLRYAREGTARNDYMTWEELRLMEESGIIDVQSHTHFHSLCFISNEIIDFNQNQRRHLGLATNGDLRYGIPIYPMRSSVDALKYYDDVELRNCVAEYVAAKGDLKRRENKTWRIELNEVVERCRAQNGIRDRYETLEEAERRIGDELSLSKKIIEQKLQKKCEYLAWPWGEYSDFSLKIAQKCGFLGFATCHGGTNTSQSDILRIKRVGGVVKGNVNTFSKQLTVYSNHSLVWMWKKVKRIALSPIKRHYKY